MRIRVELHSGEHGQPRPRTIHFDRRRLDVAETVDQWYGPDYRYIKVRTCDGETCILKFHETLAEWELTMFEQAWAQARMLECRNDLARPRRPYQ